MKKKKTTPSAKRYTITKNNAGFQVRLLPTFAIKAGDLVKEFVFDPDVHEARPGDLILRKVTIID